MQLILGNCEAELEEKSVYQKIQEILEKEQYKKITSNIPFVTLFVQYIDSSARVIQLIDCENQIKLTVQQFDIFCKRAESFIQEKGYEDVDLLSIIVTNQIGEARKFILGSYKCWIIDSANPRILIFDSQPDDFYNIKGIIEDIIIDNSNRDSSQTTYNSYEDSYERDDYDYYGQEAYGRRQSSYYNSYPAEQKGFKDEFTLINTIMVLINVVVFFAMSLKGSTEDVEFMLTHGAMYVPAITEAGQYYRFFTCMFLHFGFTHLSGNMVVLLFLGDNVERAVGKIKYILIYIFGGLIGSLGSFLYAFVYNKGIVSAGASGAIFALIGALLWLVICNKGKLENMTTLRVCVLIAYALYSGFTSPNVDMSAHLFGLMGGFLMAMILYRKPVSK